MDGIEKKTWLLLAALLFAAAVPRFWNLDGRGFLMWDEADYALESGTAPAALSHLASGRPFSGLKEALVDKGYILPSGTAKPAYIAMLSAWSAVSGRSDTALLAMNAVLGTLCVAALFLGLLPRAGPAGAAAGALLLALCGLHIWYSRSLMSNGTAGLFLLLALFAYLRAAEQGGSARYFLAGAVLSAAFMVHYSLLPNLLVLAAFEGYRLWKERREPRRGLVFAGALLGGFLLPMLLVEAAYRLVFLAFAGQLRDIAHHTYFEYLVRQFLWNSPAVNGPGWALPLYAGALADICGLPGALLLVLSPAAAGLAALRGAGLAASLFAAQAAGTLLFWAFNPGIAVLRVLAPAAPVAAAAAGLAWSRLPAGRGRSAAGLLLAAGLAAGLYLPAGEILNASAPYRQAARWLTEQGAREPVNLLNWTHLQFYLGRKIYFNHDRISSPADLDAAAAAGARYLVLDNDDDYVFSRRGGPLWEKILSAASAPALASWRMGPGLGLLAYDSTVHPHCLAEVRVYPLPPPVRRR